MEPDVMQMIMSGGANLAFAIFLYQQNKDLQRRADEREAKQERKEEELRARYDTVIKELQDKEEAMRKELVAEVNDMDKRLSLLQQQVDMVVTIINEIKTKFVRVTHAP